MRISFGDIVDLTGRWLGVDSGRVTGALDVVSRLFGIGGSNDQPGSRAGASLVPGASGGTRPTTMRAQRHKAYIKKLMDTPFRQGWQFRAEVDGQPPDFEIYVKDITYGGLTIEYESKTVGAQTFNYPDHKTAGDVTMTVRDHLDGRVEKWFIGLAGKVINQDGTVNLPPQYLTVIRLYRLLDEQGSEQLEKEWLVSAAECGEHVMAMENVTEFLSFPLVFKKFKAL